MPRTLTLAAAVLLLAAPASAQELTFGVLTPNLKVRPADAPKTRPGAKLMAARNEFESFQIVLRARGGAVKDVSVKLSRPLSGPEGATIPAANVTLYRVAYYKVKTPSNLEGAAGRWPDPLIPARDTYLGQRRNAFPMEVPAKESRVVWVDVQVPADASPGDYSGELQIDAAGEKAGTVPVSLHVGDFTLPSTATLRSAFDMDFAQPCKAHTGHESCSKEWNERKANELRELYIRSALEHRFTIANPFFQPPFGDSAKPFEDKILPHLTGTAKETRLKGARLTTVRLGVDDPKEFKKRLAYAKKKGFADRLFYYPVDEPTAEEWPRFRRLAKKLHAVDAKAKIIITAPIQETDKAKVTDLVDIFVPVINHLEDRPSAGTPYGGNQRSRYDAWLKAKPGRELWAYQSCMSHGCGECDEESPERFDTGWPNRVIDSSAVQNRAFPWHAFLYDVSCELYFEVSEQLTTAWKDNGQCKFSGSGDGTLYYPGKPSLIGGKGHIPIESIRIKMIREGMEDYEYLVLAAKKDRAATEKIARALFPKSYRSFRAPAQLEYARKRLFAMLDPLTRQETGAAPPPEVEKKYEIPDDEGLLARLVARFGKKKLAAAGGGVLLLGLVMVVGLWLLLRRRNR